MNLAAHYNLAGWDRSLRLVLGAALLYMGWFLVAGAPGVVLDAVGGVFAVTGLVGVCPVYALCGIATRPPASRS